jgi:hypothetical protein
MHTLIVPHLHTYSEYGWAGDKWYLRRVVEYSSICIQ